MCGCWLPIELWLSCLSVWWSLEWCAVSDIYSSEKWFIIPRHSSGHNDRRLVTSSPRCSHHHLLRLLLPGNYIAFGRTINAAAAETLLDWGAVLCYMNDSCRIAWWILLLVAQNQKIKCSLRVCRVRISLSPSLQIDIDWSVIDIWWSLKIILKHAPEMTGNRDRAGSESLLLGWLVVLS